MEINIFLKGSKINECIELNEVINAIKLLLLFGFEGIVVTNKLNIVDLYTWQNVMVVIHFVPFNDFTTKPATSLKYQFDKSIVDVYDFDAILIKFFGNKCKIIH